MDVSGESLAEVNLEPTHQRTVLLLFVLSTGIDGISISRVRFKDKEIEDKILLTND